MCRCYITVSNRGCSYRPLSLYHTLKMMFSVSINELSGIYSTWPAHCTGEVEKLMFFSEHLSCAHEFHQNKSHQETLNMKSSDVCNSCLFTSGPPNPVILVWFLIYSWWCYKVTCTMSNVGCLPTLEEKKEKHPTGWSMFGRRKSRAVLLA